MEDALNTENGLEVQREDEPRASITAQSTQGQPRLLVELDRILHQGERTTM
jgi:hypothetical protein